MHCCVGRQQIVNKPGEIRERYISSPTRVRTTATSYGLTLSSSCALCSFSHPLKHDLFIYGSAPVDVSHSQVACPRRDKSSIRNGRGALHSRMSFQNRALTSNLRHPSVGGSQSNSGQSPILVARINEKRAELENLKQLRDLSAGLAGQMQTLEEKLATLADGTEGTV